MKHTYSAHLGELHLNPIEEVNLEQMRLLRNSNRQWFVFSDEISSEEQECWYREYLQKEGDYMFSIYFRNMWVGTVAIYDICGSRAEFGRLMIDRKSAGRGGLGVDAVRGACQIAFEQLRLTQLYLKVYLDNIPAQITYLKAGFRPVRIKNDMLQMELLNRN